MVSVGDVVEGKVVSVMPFGAFVELGKKQSGLVHISELSRDYVKDINDHVKKGDILKVKVIKIDENGKISLSAKQAAPEKKEREGREPGSKKPVRPAELDFSKREENLSFEDKLMKFKTDSDENIRTLKRNAASKRSGGYSRKGNYSF
ncbi:MAG: S1 RNA-binding domain-containing protein [Clostridiales bacterium]|nr:S1 RNA-binding domain-containing protein [Clostridiales bacterium]